MERELAVNCYAEPEIAKAEHPFSSLKFTLNNGVEMPAIGCGTFRIRQEDDIMKLVDTALSVGYRLFDTAAVYGNESHLMKAFSTLLPKYGLEREDIFIITKLSPSEHGGKDVIRKAYLKSLDFLSSEYVDVYLVHFPGTTRLPAHDKRNKKLREETWAAMEQLYDEGLVRAIGVSNFTTRHLNEILSNHSLVPAVNQVEWHPYYHQDDLLKLCKENDIQLQAYSSFGGKSSANSDLMEDPVVKNIAKKLNVPCSQVLLVWALQQDVAVIPKSTDPTRIEQNFNFNFKLSDEDMKALHNLGEKKRKYAWDPELVT